MEQQLQQLQTQFSKLMEEVVELQKQSTKRSRSRSRKQSETRSPSERGRIPNTDSEGHQTSEKESEGEFEHRETSRKQKRKKNTRKSAYKTVLKNQNEAILALANNTKDKPAELTTAINGLSNSQIARAVKEITGETEEGNEAVKWPILRLKGEAEARVLHETIGTLKDLYKETFSGKPSSEDIPSLLRSVAQLSVSSNLSREQFYNLLRSRIRMGSTLYEDIRHHQNMGSSPKVLFQDLLPLYCNNNTYMSNLSKLQNYKPPSGATAAEVIAQVKNIAMALAEKAPGDCEKQDLVYNLVRNHILMLYPHLAPAIQEKELSSKSNSLSNFVKIFLKMAPLVEQNNTWFKPTHKPTYMRDE